MQTAIQTWPPSLAGFQLKGIPRPHLGKRFSDHLLGPRPSNPPETPASQYSCLKDSQCLVSKDVGGVDCLYSLSLSWARTATSRRDP